MAQLLEAFRSSTTNSQSKRRAASAVRVVRGCIGSRTEQASSASSASNTARATLLGSRGLMAEVATFMNTDHEEAWPSLKFWMTGQLTALQWSCILQSQGVLKSTSRIIAGRGACSLTEERYVIFFLYKHVSISFIADNHDSAGCGNEERSQIFSAYIHKKEYVPHRQTFKRACKILKTPFDSL